MAISEELAKVIEKYINRTTSYSEKRAINTWCHFFDGFISWEKSISVVLKLIDFRGKVRLKMQGRRILVIR